MKVIDIEGLTKKYETRMRKGGIIALDMVYFSVEPAEIVGLLGPNGAGKTTLFKVLLGITSATAGKCAINGLPPSNPESRSRVGYLPENHRFPNHLTGAGLLRFTGRMYGVHKEDLGHRIDQLLELVDMKRWADMKIQKYSKGMLQRIGLAQALVNDPEVLLLDEPTDGVDPVGKIDIRKVMERVRAEGKSILLNSHLLSEVESVADRVVILNRGKVIRKGAVKDLTTRGSQYQIEADFGNRLIEIPEDVGRRLSLSTSLMIIELENPEKINHVIDLLRMKKISIRAVQPMKVTLEQSFIETVTAPPEEVEA